LKIRWPRWVKQLARKTGIVPAQVVGQKGLGSRTARQTIEGRARPRPNGTIIGYVFDRAATAAIVDIEVWVGDRLVLAKRCDERKPTFAPADAPECGFTIVPDDYDAPWLDQPLTFRVAGTGQNFAAEPFMLRRLVSLDRVIAGEDRVTAVVKAPPALHRFVRPACTIDGETQPAVIRPSKSEALLVTIQRDPGKTLSLRWPSGEELAGSPATIVLRRPSAVANGRFRNWAEDRPAAWLSELRTDSLQASRAPVKLAESSEPESPAVRFSFVPNPPMQTLAAQSFDLAAIEGDAIEARVYAKAGGPAKVVLALSAGDWVEEHVVALGTDWTEFTFAFAPPPSVRDAEATLSLALRGGSPGAIEVTGLGIGAPGFQYEDGLSGEEPVGGDAVVVNGDLTLWPAGVVRALNSRRVETARGWFLAARAAMPEIAARLVEIADPEGGTGAAARYGLALAGPLEGNRLRLEVNLAKEVLAGIDIGTASMILGSPLGQSEGLIHRVDVIRRTFGEGGTQWSDQNVARIAEMVTVPERPQRITWLISPQLRAALRREAELIAPDPTRSLIMVFEVRPQALDLMIADLRFDRIAAGESVAAAELSRWDGVGIFVPNGEEIQGWAVDRADLGKPAEVEVLSDGRLLGTAIADLPHPVLQGAAYRNGRCGFSFPLGAAFQDGQRHELTLRIRGADQPLAGAPFVFRLAANRYLSHVDPVADGRLRGWVLDLEQPKKPVRLVLTVDGVRVSAAPADRMRNDVAAGRDPVARGFSFRLPGTLGEAVLATDTDGWVIARFRGSDPVAIGAPQVDLGAIDLAAESRGHVDADWYRAVYPAAAGADPALDWLETGARVGHSPNPWFDELWYRRVNPDVAEAIAGNRLHSGFAHWLTAGARELRAPGPWIDIAGYATAAMPGRALVDARDAVTRFLRDGPVVAAPTTPPPPPAPVVAPAAAPLPIDPDVIVMTDRLAELPRVPAALQRLHQRSSVYHRFTALAVADLALGNPEMAGTVEAGLFDTDAALSAAAFSSGDSDEPLISIVMPTYNRAAVIADAIRSIIDQSWTNWELLVCDDGSTDKTALVVKGFGDPRIRYLALQKANGAVARNRGLDFAEGDFIAFLDSDNLWHPLFLEASLRNLQATGAPLQYSGYLDVEMQGSQFLQGKLRFDPFDYPSLLLRNFIDLNTIMLRRAVFDRLGGFDEGLPRVQDWDLILKYVQAYHPVAMPAYPVFYRRNVAWGQVTEMFAHMNFNDIVRDKAVARLESGLEIAFAGMGARALTIVAGPAWIDAYDALAAARVLDAGTSLRLVIPDLPVNRGLVAAVPALAAEIMWVDPALPAATVADRLWGEGVVICDNGATLSALVCPLPRVDLTRVVDLSILRLAGGSGGREIPVGGLLLFPAEEIDAAVGTHWTLVVVAGTIAASRWLPLLRAHAMQGQDAILIVPDDHGGQATTFRKKGESQVALDEKAIATAIVRCDRLVVDDPTLDPARVAICASYAMASSATVVLPDQPAFADWIARRIVFGAGPDEATKTLALAVRAHGDGAAGARMRRRAFLHFNTNQRGATVATRLRFALDEAFAGEHA